MYAGDDPWWATAIGFIPIVGDVFDLVNVPIKIRKAIKRADTVHERVKKVLEIQNTKAIDLIPGKLKTKKGFPSELLEKTYLEIITLSQKSKDAAMLKKLIEQQPRLTSRKY